MDFSGKHMVITGGTGALGTAVVGVLLKAGATCTVPYMHEAEAQRFPHRNDAKVKLIAVSRSGRRSHGRQSLWRHKTMGLDPHRRRFRDGQGGGQRTKPR